MQTILFTDLIIPENRQRRKFDKAKIEDLAASIQDKGLLHPPVVRADGVTLVAGERRCRALAYLASMSIPVYCNGIKIPLGEMAVTELGNLSDYQIREAELEENLVREDLSWQEKSAAIASLHQLRIEQDPDHTVLDTIGELIGSDDKDDPRVSNAYVKVKNATLLQAHLHDPEIAEAKTEKDAIKILRRKAQRETNALLAEAHDDSKSEHTVINGDFRDAISTIPDGTISVLLTDPPYGVGADKFGEQADATHGYDDSWARAVELCEVLAVESYRVCAADAHAYVFCDIRNWAIFKDTFSAAGWDCWSTPLIWNKGNGMLPRPAHGPRRCYEAILYAIKGDKEVQSVQSDVISIQGLSRPTFGAEKPAALYTALLKRSVTPGDTVLDCFAGAGPIIPAANVCSVTAIAIELIPEKYNYILTRLNETEVVKEEPIIGATDDEIASLFDD